jgi:protein-tyrosine kinase
MSRVDEALARARRDAATQRPVDVRPIDGAAADGPVDWANEAPLHRDEPFAAEAQPIEYEAEPPKATAAPPPRVEAANDVELDQLILAEKLVVGAGVDAGSVEQFRRLAAQLYLSQTERRTRLVMVASALPGEGKTLTATNLALTLSQSYKRQVLLVDGDLRRPDLHQLFQVPNMTGLNDGIRSEVERKVPLIRISEHLTLLTAGRPDADPMSVLSSDRMRRVLAEAREKFEWVIIDTPPLGLLSDAHLLTSMIDAAVLVVQAGRTPLAAIKRAIEALGRERIVGVVLNRVDRDQLQAEYAHYYSYARPRPDVGELMSDRTNPV